MDIREFSNKFMEATKNMSENERQALLKMFESVSDEIKKDDQPVVSECIVSSNDGRVPDGITER